MSTHRPTWILLLTALVAGRAGADPRWWTHDRVITAGPEAKRRPDVAMVSGGGAAGGTSLLVAWEQETGALDTDIYLDASFDGGCTWCGPVLWAGGSGDEAEPRLAAGITPRGQLAIQVVFRRGPSEVLVASNASLAATDPPSTLCQAFSQLRSPTPTSLAAGFSVARPRIASTSAPGFLHFHAVWERDVGPAALMEYDHDLAGDGSGWGPGRVDLGAAIGEAGIEADVAADTLASTSTDSSAVVMFRSPDGTIKMTLSTDSGVTWSTPTVAVSGRDGRSLVAVDTSTSGLGDFEIWRGGVWQPQMAPFTIAFDAAEYTDPVTPMVDFSGAIDDVPVSTPPDLPGESPALALAPSLPTAIPRSPVFAFWTTGGAPSEIAARAGLLDFTGVPPRDLARFPFFGERSAPPDPTTSIAAQLSSCRWDDDWPAMTAGTCAPVPRLPGQAGASRVASADGLGDGSFVSPIVTVFADDRLGTSQIFLKSTDGGAPHPPRIAQLQPSCDGPGSASVEVTFALNAECPTIAEWIDRYLIYYGSADSEGATPAGPFLNRVAVPRAGLTDPATVRIPGLRGGETYHFAILAEDQARNLGPQSFDPRVAGNGLSIDQQASYLLPACAACLVSSLSPIAGLQGVRDGSGGAAWSWLPEADPNVREYHVNSVTDRREIRAAHRPQAGTATPECESPAGTTACTDPDATGGTPRLFYQAFSACGADGLDEGP